LRAKGYSQRKTAKSIGINIGSVNKYDNRDKTFKNNINEQINELRPSGIFSDKDEKFEEKTGEATFI